MKVIDILKAVGIDEQCIPEGLNDRLQYDVMIQEGINPFLIDRLSVQPIRGGTNRLLIHIDDRPLNDPWRS